MTTEDLIESFITEGIAAYKKNHRHSLHGRMLDRHEPVEISGVTFSCWRELAVYAMAEHIQDVLPDADVSVIMDGNNSTIELCVSKDEQRKLNSSLYVFLKKYGSFDYSNSKEKE